MLPEDNQPIEIASSRATNYNTLIDPNEWLEIPQTASFVHYCQNETVHGYQFKDGLSDDESASFPFHLVP